MTLPGFDLEKSVKKSVNEQTKRQTRHRTLYMLLWMHIIHTDTHFNQVNPTWLYYALSWRKKHKVRKKECTCAYIFVYKRKQIRMMRHFVVYVEKVTQITQSNFPSAATREKARIKENDTWSRNRTRERGGFFVQKKLGRFRAHAFCLCANTGREFFVSRVVLRPTYTRRERDENRKQTN